MRRRTFIRAATSMAGVVPAPYILRAKEERRMVSDPSGPRKLQPFMPRKYNVSHMGVLHACIDQAGVEVDPAWLFGVTGYAFMMNLCTRAMVAGPTGWNFTSMLSRTPNVGIDCSEFVYSWSEKEARAGSKAAGRGSPDFAEKKQQTIALVKGSWDAGVPAYSAEFGFPEFFTIGGYNEKGVLGHSWCLGEGKAQLFTWESLGVADSGVLIVSTVKKSDGTADDTKAIKDSLLFAVEVGHAEQGYLKGDAVGLRAYNAWISKLREQLKADSPKHPEWADHHTENWWECRQYAPQFLRQASEKTTSDVSRDLRSAAEQYDKVLEAWNAVRNLCHYGMKPEEHTRESLSETIKHLQAAKEAETRGLEMLQKISKGI